MIYDCNGKEVSFPLGKKSSPWFPVLFMVAALLLNVGVVVYGDWNKKTSSVFTGVSSGGDVILNSAMKTINDLHNGIPVLDGYYQRQLSKAIGAWEKQIGPLFIARPKLEIGLCPGTAYACADTARNTITIQGLQGDDGVTILMHEVGHLLGVPHIEGDALMNGFYISVLVKPTPFAVAIAKTVKASKERAK